MIPIKQKDAIKARLQERIPKLECPMCHQYSFVLLDGYLTENIQENYNSIVIGNGEIFPTTAIVCTHCGYVARFALGALGLLQQNQKIDNSEVTEVVEKEHKATDL